MNIFKFEIRMLRRSTLIWASAISFFILFYMMFFPLLMAENDAMGQLLENFPDEFLAFFGMSDDLSFTSLMGYFGLTFSFAWVPLAIQSSYLGFHILSVEERELTADFLLSKPISRNSILFQKVLAASTALGFTSLCVVLSSYLSLLLFNSGDEIYYLNTLILLLTLPVFQLFFLSVGMLFSVVLKKVSSVISYAMGLGFGMFILSSFGEMLSLEPLKLLTPFSHFEPVGIISSGSWNILYTCISIFVILTSLFLTYFFYQRRNIPSL